MDNTSIGEPNSGIVHNLIIISPVTGVNFAKLYPGLAYLHHLKKSGILIINQATEYSELS